MRAIAAIALMAVLGGSPAAGENPTTVRDILQIANINYQPISVVPWGVAAQERVAVKPISTQEKTRNSILAAEKKLAELQERLGVCCQYNASNPHIPETGMLEINNLRTASYRIRVNGTEHYLTPGTTKLSVPVGTVLAQLIGHGSPQFLDSSSWKKVNGQRKRTLNLK